MEGENQSVNEPTSIKPSRPSVRGIRPWPKDLATSGGVREALSTSRRNQVSEPIGSGELLSSGTGGPTSNASRDPNNSQHTPRGTRRSRPVTEQFNRRVRDTAGDNGNPTQSAEPNAPAQDAGTGSGSESLHRRLLQEGLNAPVPNFAPVMVETSTKLNLPENGQVEQTAMLQRQLSSVQERTVSAEPLPEDLGARNVVPPNPLPRGPGRPPGSTKKNQQNKTQETAPPKKPETISVVPDYKFDKATFKALVDWFVWSSKGVDLGIDYGLGIDTSLIPIWELDEKEAEVFVRILERRASTSEYVRDVVVVKMLASRDYIEAGLILAPKFGATVQAVVEQGGPKPHFRKGDR